MAYALRAIGIYASMTHNPAKPPPTLIEANDMNELKTKLEIERTIRKAGEKPDV
jgi:hypothetical protein